VIFNQQMADSRGMALISGPFSGGGTPARLNSDLAVNVSEHQ
jgi:hypothetical protein